jgi:hypothetical protein
MEPEGSSPCSQCLAARPYTDPDAARPQVPNLLLRDKGKGKVVPVLNQAPRHEDVLREWRYRFTYSLTSELDGGGQFRAPAALPPG